MRKQSFGSVFPLENNVQGKFPARNFGANTQHYSAPRSLCILREIRDASHAVKLPSHFQGHQTRSGFGLHSRVVTGHTHALSGASLQSNEASAVALCTWIESTDTALSFVMAMASHELSQSSCPVIHVAG